MARIAVGIPIFNEERFVASTLLSVLAQLEHFPDVEIVISDNGSTDKTRDEIFSILNAIPHADRFVRFEQHDVNQGAGKNFWHVFDCVDSDYFLWVGGHDQISPNYVAEGIRFLAGNPRVSMVCGSHKAITSHGAVLNQPITYDFSQENSVERYLLSIANLNNCYIFHSIFDRSYLDTYDREFKAPSADHIVISRLLWFGCLAQLDSCSYARRYFSSEDRARKKIEGSYVTNKNNIEFYELYLHDLCTLMQSVPCAIKDVVIRKASDLLVQRFGLPYLK